jgi:hypothetical protein
LNVPLSTPVLQALENNYSLVTLETVDDASVPTTKTQKMKRQAYLDRNRHLSTLMRTLPANARIRPTLRVAAIMPTTGRRLAHNNTLRGLLTLGDLK